MTTKRDNFTRGIGLDHKLHGETGASSENFFEEIVRDILLT